jgi:alginate O-acetyltransferase complex protein AlgI
MLFNTLQYGGFLFALVLIQQALPHRHRPWLLLLASYLFYASWNALFLPLILALTGVNYVFGLGLARRSGRASANGVLVAAVGLDLAVLGFFKYANFARQSLAPALGLLGLEMRPEPLPIIAPLGISFFVFEFIHYLVDVRRGGPPVRSLRDFALFCSFFPTQIAGPIKRYQQFVPQIERHPPLDAARAGGGLELLAIGLFKKVAVADNLAPLVAAGFRKAAPGSVGPSAGDAWLVVLAFAMQIYLDFSAYTDMARGSALLLGYDVPENFRRPYLSSSVAEFWRRWHISLSSWLRDYVYIPLGGGRRARDRNLLVTMILGGLWHGANWTFVLWGGLHGLVLVVSRHLEAWRPQARARGKLLGWAVTMVVVCVGWVFFRATTFAHAVVMLGAMAGGRSGAAGSLLETERWFVMAVVAGTLAVELAVESREPIRAWVQQTSGGRALTAGLSVLRPALYVMLMVLTLIMKPSAAPPFIYFRF